MPWTPAQFRSRHNHSLSPTQATHAAAQANAILRSGAPEGIAIATANKHAKHFDDGGAVAYGAAPPSSATMNPVSQSLLQRYAAMPVEQLTQLATMLGSSPQGQMVQRILQQKRMMPNVGQAAPQGPGIASMSPGVPQAPGPGIAPQTPQAPTMRRGGMLRRADGGPADMSEAPQADRQWPPTLEQLHQEDLQQLQQSRDPAFQQRLYDLRHNIEPILNQRRVEMETARGGRMPHYDSGGSLPPSLSYLNDLQFDRSGPIGTDWYLPPSPGRGTSSGVGGNASNTEQMLEQMHTRLKPILGYRSGGTPHFDMGGGMSLSQMNPWWERSQAREMDSGMLHSSVPGRTDQLQISPPGGSYVIPADVVSGIGEGNSLAGARMLQEAMSTGPYGVPLPPGHRGPGPPRAPDRTRMPMLGESAGGRHAKPTPILAAGGEFLVHPRDVTRIGGGDLKRGHDRLDKFVIEQRRKTVRTMSKLPGPKK